MSVIRIERGNEVDGPNTIWKDAPIRHGKWYWSCAEFSLEGYSRQPLLDACREIKRMGGPETAVVAVFKRGASIPDISCQVGIGVAYTVEETKFRKIRAG